LPDAEAFPQASPFPEPEAYSRAAYATAQPDTEEPDPFPAGEPLPDPAASYGETPLAELPEPPVPETTFIDERGATAPIEAPEPTAFVPPPAAPATADALPFSPSQASAEHQPPRRFGLGAPTDTDAPSDLESSRPSQEDLAALDALLNPAATRRTEKRGAGEKWEPQFRPNTATLPPVAPRRPQLRVAPGGASPSRLPIVLTAVAAVALTTVAAWYFFLRSPRPVDPAAQGRPAPDESPLVAAATPLPTSTIPDVLPTAAPTLAPAPTATPAVVATAPAPLPLPTATQPAAPPSSADRPPATAGSPRPSAAGADADARALLAQGTLPDAARTFARSLGAGSRGRFTAQLLTACSPENVQKAVVAGGDDVFILPVAVKGQSCYRVCWGLFDERSAAEAALSGLPAYFRQNGVRPRLTSIAEIAP
jgi:hypothetical protein